MPKSEEHPTTQRLIYLTMRQMIDELRTKINPEKVYRGSDLDAFYVEILEEVNVGLAADALERQNRD